MAKNSGGYTLVELLVVIVIIAILAGLSFPVGGKVIESAKKAQARNDIKSIEEAVRNYTIEYSRLPILPSQLGGTGGWAGLRSGIAQGEELLRALSGADDAAIPNPRGLVFLEGKIVDDPRGGMTTANGETTPSGFWDPWGNPYQVFLDADMDRKINPGDPDEPTQEIVSSVLVASTGPKVSPGPT